MNILQHPKNDVDIGLEEGAGKHDNAGDVVLGVHSEAGIISKYEWGLYDEYYSTEGYKNVDDIKQDDGFLEEHPGKDDDPDGGGGTDHVGVSHGHVLQTVEVDDEVTCTEHRS